MWLMCWRSGSRRQGRPSADFESISSAFKRMKNILRQACEAGKQPAATLNVLALQS